MAGVICVWANLPDELTKWYEDDYIPRMRGRHSRYTVHCKLFQSGFEGEPLGKLDAPWSLFTLYEVDEVTKATASLFDKDNHPSEEMLAGSLAKATFDVRTYRELASFKQDDWVEDPSHITTVSAIEWRVTKEKRQEVYDWYTASVCPLIMESPDVLRYRVLEVDAATTLQGTSYETKEKDSLHTFLSLVELETDQWPWELVLELGEQEEWKQYFENPEVVKWQISTYAAQRVYQADDEASKEA